MIRASAQNTRAEPPEIVPRRNRVRLTLNVPVTIWRKKWTECRTLAEVRGPAFTGAALFQLRRPHVLFEILGRIQHGTRFDQSYIDPEIGKHFDGGASTCSGSNDNDVVDRTAAIDLHMSLSYQTRIIELCTITIRKPRWKS